MTQIVLDIKKVQEEGRAAIGFGVVIALITMLWVWISGLGLFTSMFIVFGFVLIASGFYHKRKADRLEQEALKDA